MTGVCAAASTVAALRIQRACGAGQRIDMALYDCAFQAMATFLPRPLAGNPDPIRRAGNRHAMIAPWNVYQARNGWVLICVGSDAQWQRLCGIMHRADLLTATRFARTADRVAHAAEIDAVVQTWVGGQTVEACVAALNEAQIPCGPIVRIDGYPREPNLEHRGMIRHLRDPATGRDIILPSSPLHMSASPGRAPARIPAADADHEDVRQLAAARAPRATTRPTNMPAAALAGVRILEIGHYTTVPLATRLLASLGAEVIKIEPPEGEATRDWPPLQCGQGYFFTYTNADKRSLVLDLQREADTAVLRDLIRTADVLIENLKPGALARRGFSPEAVAALNAALITCSISGFGAHSLYAGRPAYDSVVQAMSGLMDVVRSGGIPLKTGISTADLLGAEMGVLAVLAALAYRDRTGRGQYIDLSMQDITAWLTQTAWNDAGASPPCVIACRDGHVLVDGPPAPIDAFARDAHHLTKREVAARLAERNIPAAPVLTVHEMLAEPRTSVRELWFHATENSPTWPLLASPLRLTATPSVVRKPMPALGRDTDAILAALRKAAAPS
jgi:crotonobetainyl-CoA:carnitine CoA-transferase CaiB-like acyl-CoA transferase